MATFKQQDIELSNKRKRYKEQAEKIGKKLGNQIRAGKITMKQAKKILREKIKPPSGCYQFQNPYHMPKASNSFEFWQEYDDECGKGCQCVDKNVNRKALNKLNLNKQLNPFWTCDGEHWEESNYPLRYGQEPSHRSALGFLYIGDDKRKLHKTLKQMCNSSEIYAGKRIPGSLNVSGQNVCKSNKQVLPKGDISVVMKSKKRNSSKWWDDVANSLNQLNNENKY